MADKKQEELSKIKVKMLKANLPLKKTAQNLVFGEGSLDPQAFFIGEAPGANEDKQGLPFVGTAGKNLDSMLEAIKLTRQEVYITSIIKYRPPDNRQPTLSEIKAHTPYLKDQIRIIKPRLIVTLGNFATRFILGGLDTECMSSIPGISQIRGKAQIIHFNGQQITILPMYHPAALLYNRSLEKIIKDDFLFLSEYCLNLK